MKLKLILFAGLLSFVSFTTLDNDKVKKSAVVEKTTNDDLKAQFATDIEAYMVAFSKKKWDVVVDMIYPKLFEHSTKSTMIDSFKLLGKLGMNMKIKFKSIEKVSDIIEDGDLQFCRVYYNADVTVKMKGVVYDNRDEIEKSFNKTYGTENVTLKKKSFIIDSHKSMLAISKKGSNEWKYIEYNEDQNKIFKKVIPENVIEKLK